jgi:hypothetical protein
MAKTTIPGTQPIPTAANSSTQFAYFGVNTAFTDPQTGYLTTYGQRFLNQQILPALKNATAVTSFAFQSQYGIEGKVTNINGAVSLALFLENITPASINCSGVVIAEEFIGSGAGLTDIPFSAIVGSAALSNPMSSVGDMIWGDVAGAPSRLAGYTGSNLAVLTQIGTGGSSQEPVWTVPANGLTGPIGPTGATGGTGNTGTAGSFTIGNKTLLGNNTGSTGVPYGIGLATGLQFFGLAALGVNLANPGPIGGATASTGAFTSINLTVYAVASLPSGVQGMKAMVNNALTPSFGVAVVGGGTVVTPVFYNGSAWIVG